MREFMLEAIVEEIEVTYDTKVEVAYDFMPLNAYSILDLIDVVLDEEVGDWVTSGEAYVLRSKSDGKEQIDILLLKRGVELSFELPQSFVRKANKEMEK